MIGEVVRMTAVMGPDSVDVLAGWVDRRQAAAARTRVRRSPPLASSGGGIRFAFYGRISTVDFQDRESSRRWQWDCATDLIAGHGVVVAEFFDVGCSRRRAWVDRPRAGALLAAVEDPDRGFDAIVVGEYERAFYGDQLTRMAPLLRRHGVRLWLPELGGPVDCDDPTHQAVVMLLGYRRSVRFCGPGFVRLWRFGPRPGSRAGIWVGGRRTGIGWWTRVRIRTGRTPGGAGGCTGWSLTRPPHRM
ncbi:recombinase family protein [Solwaraspora sp. WMMB335]|uniref:recombinase family protein n=1 Tax=Solwaraspora sp. WMMB335 TaxID=3404118 RepID=UPI003B95EF38